MLDMPLGVFFPVVTAVCVSHHPSTHWGLFWKHLFRCSTHLVHDLGETPPSRPWASQTLRCFLWGTSRGWELLMLLGGELGRQSSADGFSPRDERLPWRLWVRVSAFARSVHTSVLWTTPGVGELLTTSADREGGQ